MISFQNITGVGKLGRNAILAAAALAVVACAPVDDTIGSRLAQPPPGSTPKQAVDAGDIAIVGQDVSHEIMALPAIADASVPPLVEFNGVTSIVSHPVDTTPYTELLRDRLILLTREKLRFQEHTLPMYVAPSRKKGKKSEGAAQPSSEVDYKILAELRGHEDDAYKIQIQFIDVHTNDVLFDGLYNIRKEAEEQVPDASPQTQGPGAPPPLSAPSDPTSPPLAPTSPTL
jgi:hypothetical protein